MTNKEAIKLLQQIEEDGWNVMNFHIEALELAIKALEERPTGEWIEDELHNVVCSICGGIRRDCRVDYINYCNKCGAKMKGEEE